MSLSFRNPTLVFFKLCDRLNSLVHPPSIIQLNESACYIDVPKVASSFIKSSICSSGYVYAGAGPTRPHSNLFIRPSWKSLETTNRIICFWKDPIDRFCSVIREKFSLSSNPSRWSPYALPLPCTFYDSESIDYLVDRLVSLPHPFIDKHLLPQYCFSANYTQYSSFRLINHLFVGRELLSLGYQPEYFPDSKISLKTNPNLFTSSDMSKTSVQKLKNFYDCDYFLANQFGLI